MLLMAASQAMIELMKKAAVVDDQYQLLRYQISIGWSVATADITTDLRKFATLPTNLLKQTDSKASRSSSHARPDPSYCNEFIRHTSVLMDVYAERGKLFSIPD